MAAAAGPSAATTRPNEAAYANLLNHVNDIRRQAVMPTFDQHLATEGYGWLELFKQHAVSTRDAYLTASSAASSSATASSDMGTMTAAMGEMLKTPSRARSRNLLLGKAKAGDIHIADLDPDGEDKENAAAPAPGDATAAKGPARVTRSKADKSQVVKPPNAFQAKLEEAKAREEAAKIKRQEAAEAAAAVEKTEEAARASEDKKREEDEVQDDEAEAEAAEPEPAPAPAKSKSKAKAAPKGKKAAAAAAAKKAAAEKQEREAKRREEEEAAALEAAETKERAEEEEQKKRQAPADDSMEVDASLAVRGDDDEHPRESTPPPPSPKKDQQRPAVAAQQIEDADLESIAGRSDFEYDETEAHTQPVTARASDTKVDDEVEEDEDGDETNKEPEAQKQAPQPKKLSSLVKPSGEKRTLASFSAKKSLAASLHGDKAPLPQGGATTPASSGFRSTFLTKSLRKGAQHDDEGADDEDAEDGQTALNTKANAQSLGTKTNTSKSDSSAESSSSRKRKSETELDSTDGAPATSKAKKAEQTKAAAASKAKTASTEHDQLLSRIGKFSAKTPKVNPPDGVTSGQTSPTGSHVVGLPASISSNLFGRAMPQGQAASTATAPPAAAPAPVVEQPVTRPASPAKQPLTSTTPMNSPGKAVQAPTTAPRSLAAELGEAEEDEIATEDSLDREESTLSSAATGDKEMTLDELIVPSSKKGKGEVERETPAPASSATIAPAAPAVAPQPVRSNLASTMPHKPLSAMPKFSVNLTGKSSSAMQRPLQQGAPQPQHSQQQQNKAAPAGAPAAQQQAGGWGSKLKGLFGMSATQATNASVAAAAAAAPAAASSGFMPKSSQNTGNSAATTANGRATPLKTSTVGGPSSTLASSTSSAAVKGQGAQPPASIARAEAARRNELNEAAKRAKEKDLRMQQLKQSKAGANQASVSKPTAADEAAAKKRAREEELKAKAAATAGADGKKRRLSEEPGSQPASGKNAAFNKAGAPRPPNAAGAKAGAPPSMRPVTVPTAKGPAVKAPATQQQPPPPRPAPGLSAKAPQTGNFSAQNPFQQQPGPSGIQRPANPVPKGPPPQQHLAPKPAPSAAPTPAKYAPSPRQSVEPDDAGYETLPSIYSDYSDSEDEEQTAYRRRNEKAWVRGEELMEQLRAQEHLDADAIFGVPSGTVPLENIMGDPRSREKILRRPRTSSGNWDSSDRLAQWEVDRYNERMGIQGPGVRLSQNPQGIQTVASAAAAAAAATLAGNKTRQSSAHSKSAQIQQQARGSQMPGGPSRPQPSWR